MSTQIISETNEKVLVKIFNEHVHDQKRINDWEVEGKLPSRGIYALYMYLSGSLRIL